MAARALQELRRLRDTGRKRIETYEVEEEERLYEEVDEEGYKKVVRKRLDEDDFVVDDNGEGYADDGREEWDDGARYADETESDEEDQQPLKGKAGKRKCEQDRERKDKVKNGINKYFNATATASTAPKKRVATAEDAAFMADLLGEIDTNVPSSRFAPQKAIKSVSRRKTRVLSPPLSHSQPKKVGNPRFPKSREDDYMVDTPPPSTAPEDDVPMPPIDDDPADDVPMSDPPVSSPVTKAVERKAQTQAKMEEDDDDDFMEVAQAVGSADVRTTNLNIAGKRPVAKPPKPALPTPESSSPIREPETVDASAWNKVTSSLNVVSGLTNDSTSFGKLNPQNALEPNGSLRIFWMDYTEINGSLCLFGKVKDKTTGNYVSCFVKVDNILRKLFFLPREYRRRNNRDTDEEVEMSDVYQEVDGLMSKLGVGMHKIKPCTRKYAFELADVPKEADYLKLLYPYTNAGLSTDISGETFSHVFGANTALFEQFVLWKNIMGPCWLTIDGADFSAITNASWCKLELQVTKPNMINVLSDTEVMEDPPLTLMSIALRTAFNAKENKQEILVASARIYENVGLSDVTPPEKLPCKSFTVMRPNGETYPTGFKMEVEKHRGTIRMEKTEQGLLSYFMAMLQRTDPDVLMGHRLDDVDYGILLSRMRELRTPGWHRIGRLRRSEWPKNMGKGGGSFFVERQLAAGRLLCDLANDLGKSLMTKCQSWSLNEMVELVLGKDNARSDLDNESALKTWAKTREGLMNYITHCEGDTFFIAAIALKVQVLPLTKVLTNLAGNSWARTLSGTRAERNEYILLHEFHKNKYICPDKIHGKWKPKVEEEEPEGEENADGKKKDKYKGGLVFEPEKGLYDKIVLVMDFNSLYPSIIQEFNICFTTVERSNFKEEDENVPEVPTDMPQGILPRLIATLVNRRREVKRLMKDKTASQDQLKTWDIKQLALKLTANSMYGCLGYTRSRFYARPLAMLTTFKGREILQSTKSLAESTLLQVVYGDTDSVMINTNVDTIEEALKVGNEFKRSVNERYKLLEIDIDNVFRRLLLHAKKKYAAINMVEVNGKFVEKLEVKGLDMRRREYCALSKETSSNLLNFLLSGDDPDAVIQKSHEYLRSLAEKMRSFSVPVPKYTIYTQLGKDPREYPNKQSMPQVQVALRLISKGRHVKAKDVMSFIITGNNNGSQENAARNAYTLEEVMKKDSDLKPDVDYYLTKQILPPVERLCAPVSGTSVVELANCLGLDGTKYRVSTTTDASQDNEIHPLESQIPDHVRFKDCAPLSLRCPACRFAFPYRGIAAAVPRALAHDGLRCPRADCGTPLATLCVVAQTEAAVRAHVARYYDAWLVCDDAACGVRTRQMSVAGQRCLGPQGLARGCRGRMRPEFGERALYNQLLYLERAFDVDTAKKALEDEKAGAEEGLTVEKAEKVRVLAEVNRQRFGTMKEVVRAALEKNGRLWVAMDSLFGFALQAQA
ncbi:DNA polymerase alpha catalytic subunit A [Lineolata rhizophorae]|uniref:DNA polymerase n=1 Tax=Lineolata rhizophorae TaxID=578093 RepID=A0A6A6NNJ1_9PEZI|nr:DNA polymerase alpha catalytic subunit A [Lineolata rhizophorae]